jgi:hypothetical protein
MVFSTKAAQAEIEAGDLEETIADSIPSSKRVGTIAFPALF